MGFLNAWGLQAAQPGPAGATVQPAADPGRKLWPRMAFAQVPRSLLRAVISPDQQDLLSEIIGLFPFSDDLINLTQRDATSILKDTVEAFSLQRERPEEIHALLTQKEIDRQAQRTLLDSVGDGLLDVRQLRRELTEALRREYLKRGMSQLAHSETQLIGGLHKILALRPRTLRQAILEAARNHIEVIEAAPLPAQIEDTAAEPARLNLYGMFPSDLNTWEQAFARLLDDDLEHTVAWWHRNPPRKPYSTAVPLPGQHQQSYYYPDFVIGVPERTWAGGIALVEVKRDLNDVPGNARAKAQVEHPAYKKILMVHLHDNEWRIVEYDAERNLNVLAQPFRIELLKYR